MNLTLLAPELALAATAAGVILLDLFTRRKGALTLLSLAGIAVSMGLAIPLLGAGHQTIWNGLLALDGLAVFFKLFFLGLAFMIVLAGTDYASRLRRFHGEYHALILTATLGMMLMASATDLISIFVSLELTAISFYALVGFLKDDRSTEASLKYVLLGGVNSAVLLYGLALIFGFTGQTHLADVAQAVKGAALSSSPGLVLGLVLVLAVFGFKAAMAPFHMWVPDTYEGAPTPITLFLSTGSKMAALAVLLRVFLTAFSQPLALSQDWGMTVAVLAALGMTAGNLLAIQQTNIKRLLAYSGIAHSGYMLVALATTGLAGTARVDTQGSLLFYMLAFVLAELAAFTSVIIASQTLKSETIADYAGLAKRSPLLAVVLTIGLLSLLGLPPTAGFMAKFFLFSQAVSGGLLWLVIIAVVNSVISAYYYLRVVKLMWLEKPVSTEPLTSSLPPRMVLAIAALGVLAMGLLPVWMMNLAELGAKLLLP